MPWNALKKQVACFVPDGASLNEALVRTTHLGIGAHPDDLEFMAFHGIAACYDRDEEWFGAVICAGGTGSLRKSARGKTGSDSIAAMRWAEQKAAASIGRYSFALRLPYSSQQVRRVAPMLVQDLKTVLQAARPEIIYTHNPADKHPTHVGVCMAVLSAIRMLPKAERPRRVLGCEMWRGLDWLPDRDKVVLDVSANPRLARSLARVFMSQIGDGKRYDLAVEGRMRANATFLDPRAPDKMDKAWYAMDLTPLVRNDDLDVTTFVMGAVQRFSDQVERALRQGRRQT